MKRSANFSIIFFGILIFFDTSAYPNDSVATIATSGLQLEKTDSISMESELLQLSTELIRVKYVFKNESKTDIKTVVA